MHDRQARDSGSYDRQARDSGSYLIVLRLMVERSVTIGSLGRLTFLPGYYVYVGSAMNGLAARIARHRRVRKPFHWHIDYLRRHARFYWAVAIRSRARLECRLAARVRQVAEWDVPGFGCSDCGCRSHLFGFSSEPLRLRDLRSLAKVTKLPPG